MASAMQIKEHMEVIGSDGEHVGVVDKVEGGNRLKLTKNDPNAGGEHHFVPMDWVDHVDAHVHLAKPSAEVMSNWKTN